MKTIVKNKKANFEYEILDIYESGIVLTGDDVKNIRSGKLNISDSFCNIINNEIFLNNLVISSKNDIKKLLLNKKEINQLKSKVEQHGLTIIPLEVYDNNGLIKVKITLAKGKKLYNKKQDIKEKDLNKELWRTIKNY